MRKLAAALTAIALLAGCASIPTSGAVLPVTASPNVPASRGADIAPGPPIAGASPDQLVAGFLVAMAAGQPGFSVARKYLTPEANQAWHPEETGAQIYDADRNPPISTADNARIDAPLLGQIDAVGHFSTATGRVTHDFRLVRVKDEWRISAPPAGLLISHYMFGRYYQSYPVYFFNTHQNLVPELVHLPISQVSPEAVLGALLRGPSSWLAPAVTTSVPAGTQLIKAAIDDKGVAQVDLGTQVEHLNSDEKRRLGAQIIWTLTSFPRVSAVNITMRGQPYTIPGQSGAGELDLANQQGFQVLSGPQTNDLFALSAGRIGRVTDTAGFMPVLGTLGQAGAGVTAFGLSLDGATVAALDGSGKLRYGPSDDVARQIDLGISGAHSPQVVLGNAWVAGTNASGQQVLVRVDQAGKVTPVAVDAPGNITKFSIGPAGARVALILERDGSARLFMGRLEEASDALRVTGVSELQPVVDGDRLTRFTAVEWSGEATLAVLASTDGTTHHCYTLASNGAAAAVLGPSGDRDLASLSVPPRKSGLIAVALASDGRVLRYDARSRWQLVQAPAGISAVVYAG